MIAISGLYIGWSDFVSKGFVSIAKPTSWALMGVDGVVVAFPDAMSSKRIRGKEEIRSNLS